MPFLTLSSGQLLSVRDIRKTIINMPLGVIIVAGGGGGGSMYLAAGGGGGAGGLVTTTLNYTTDTIISYSVGAGGVGG